MTTDFDIALDQLHAARDDLRRRENGGDSAYVQICRVRLRVIHAGFIALYGRPPEQPAVAVDRGMRVSGGAQL